jgi:hypothetical protein
MRASFFASFAGAHLYCALEFSSRTTVIGAGYFQLSRLLGLLGLK